jgi:hypothetical protein
MSPEVVDLERRRQVAVSIDLGEQLAGLLLDGRDRIAPATQRILLHRFYGLIWNFRTSRSFIAR